MSMETHSIEEAIRLAERRWSGLEFRRKGTTEACSSCPFCRQAVDDGFLIFSDPPRFWCRKCNVSGFLNGKKDNRRLTEAELTQIRLKRLEQKQHEHERRLTALERLNASQAHLRYHDNLDGESFAWWMDKGAAPETILDYKLGYCPRCPTDREHRPSHTIPLWDYDRRLLWNIRHRLESANGGDKYRPEMAGLGNCLAFPHHLAGAEYGVIVEGSIKALVTHQHGFPTVGVLGKRGRFKTEWLQWFPDGPIYIALDPDAADSADRLGVGIHKARGGEVRVCAFPCKPDDLFALGGTTDDFAYFLGMAKRMS